MIFLSGWRVRSVLFAIQTLQQSQACSKEYKISTLQYSFLHYSGWSSLKLKQCFQAFFLASNLCCIHNAILLLAFRCFSEALRACSILLIPPFCLCLWLTLGGRDEIPRRVPASKAKLFQFLLLNLKLCFCVSLYLNICLTWHSPLGEPLSMAIMYQGQPALMRWTAQNYIDLASSVTG